MEFQVKFAEVTLDTYRMLQCLEWEPSAPLFQKRSYVPNDHSGASIYHSETSGAIDINFSMDMSDPMLPPNPRKAVLYRPSVTHLLAVSFKASLLFTKTFWSVCHLLNEQVQCFLYLIKMISALYSRLWMF